VGEIGGAVEWIDVPAVAGSGGAVVASAFFGGNSVVWEQCCDAGDDGAFGALVCLGDQVDFVALVGNFRGASKFFAQNLAGFTGYVDSSLKIIFRHQELEILSGNFSIASLSGAYSGSAAARSFSAITGGR
jgi:hypothetical protein